MKKMAITFLVVFMTMISVTFAGEKYKAHFLTYTTSAYNLAKQSNENYTERRLMEIGLSCDLYLSQGLEATDSLINFNPVYFGPYHLSYEEEDISQAIGDIYGSLTTEGHVLNRALDSLKKLYNIDVMTSSVYTKAVNYVKRGESIMLTPLNRQINDYCGDFLETVNPHEGGNHTMEPYLSNFPEGYPYSSDDFYTTLGHGVGRTFPFYAHLDSAWYYYENPQGNPDSIYVAVGDDNHNVLDPERGWDLSKVLNDNGTDLGFRVKNDTITLQAGISRQLQIYPGWNNENTGDVLYAIGDNMWTNQEFYPDKPSNYAVYSTSAVAAADPGDEFLIGVGLNVPHLTDVFTLDRILVRAVEHLEIPGIDVSDNIKEGETFTVTFTGTPELMTSWEPQLTFSGVGVDLVSKDGWTWTYKALTSGNLTVNLHHTGILPEEWEPYDMEVTRKIKGELMAPTAPVLSVADESTRTITWTAVDEVDSYSVYRSFNGGAFERIITTSYTTSRDTADLGNATYTYYVIATNEAGASPASNEVTITITGIYELVRKEEGTLYPNPATDYLILDRSNIHDIQNLVIIDITGKTVKELPPTSKVSVGDLPRGVYYLVLEQREILNQVQDDSHSIRPRYWRFVKE